MIDIVGTCNISLDLVLINIRSILKYLLDINVVINECALLAMIVDNDKLIPYMSNSLSIDYKDIFARIRTIGSLISVGEPYQKLTKGVSYHKRI